MKSTWNRLSAWAYGLESRQRWQLWIFLAFVAVALQSALPSPWSWATTIVIGAFGVMLFNAQARRERDEKRQGPAPRK